MLKHLISQGNFAVWPLISLVLFVAVFTAILVWVSRRAKAQDDAMADLVFDDVSKVKGVSSWPKSE